MLDFELAREAFRDRAETLVVATTGTTSLGATATAFTRSVGSFLTDGFRDGMELTGAGWPGTLGAAKIVIGPVSALSLPIAGGGLAVTAEAAARSLTVGLPQKREWEGTQTPATTAPATRPKIGEQWVPATPESFGQPPTISLIVETGFYILDWYGLGNKGVLAMYRQMKKLRELFPPGYSVFAGADMLRVEGNPAPAVGQLLATDNGYLVSSLRIPWRVVSANVDVTAA